MKTIVLLGFIFIFTGPSLSLRINHGEKMVEDFGPELIDSPNQDAGSEINAGNGTDIDDEICVHERAYFRFSQKYALLSIYDTFGLTPGRYLETDSQKDNECTWLGVTCTDGIVTKLDLRGKKFVRNNGEPFDDLNLLVNLEWIDFSQTGLFGDFPTLTGLTKLVVIDVSETFLWGKFTGNDVCAPNGSARAVAYYPNNGNIGFDCNCDTNTTSVCSPVSKAPE